MKFKERLIQGTLIKRYKRFFADIEYKSNVIVAHCPNTGSMQGLLKSGNKVWFSKSNDPKRKLKYTLEIIEVNKKKIGINTLRANKIVLEALQNKMIKSLSKFKYVQTEVKFSNNTRFDFLLSNNKEQCFLEVKNVTLFRKTNLAEFPDSITERGKKHLLELIKAKKKGYQSFILFLIQREKCDSFKIAKDIDKDYELAFMKAINNGIKILCYNCKLSDEEIVINNKINYELLL